MSMGKIDMIPWAETSRCLFYPDRSSIVANGEYGGKTLVDALEKHSEWMGTKV